MSARKNLCLAASLSAFFLFASHFSAAQQVSRYDLFGGYSFLRLDSRSYGFLDDSNLSGGTLAGAFNITRRFSAVADVSAQFASNEHFYTFMAGPQVSLHKYGGTLFAHALFGKGRNGDELPGVPSNLGRSFAFGGGFDLPFRRRFSIRVLQADYLTTHTYGANQNNIRVSAGVIFHFGKTLK